MPSVNLDKEAKRWPVAAKVVSANSVPKSIIDTEGKVSLDCLSILTKYLSMGVGSASKSSNPTDQAKVVGVVLMSA